MKYFIKILINTVAIILTAEILPGIDVSPLSAIMVALLLSILNVTLKPILILLTIPFTIVTFGLFLLVINALMILLAGSLIRGFEVHGFWWAVLFSVVLALINSIMEKFIFPEPKQEGNY